MKKLLFLLLVLLIPLKLKAAIFIKVDEQGNYINDAEFKVHSLDGSIEYEVVKTKEAEHLDANSEKTPTPMSVKKLALGDILDDGQYYFENYGTENYNKLLNILGPEERQIVEGLKNLSNMDYYEDLLYGHTYATDYERYQATRGIGFIVDRNCMNNMSSTKNYRAKFMEGETDSTQQIICEKITVDVPVLMILEETKAPQGLKKSKAIVEYLYRVVYEYDESYNYINNPTVTYMVTSLYKYDYELDYSNMLDLVRKKEISTNDDELYFKDDCGDYYKSNFVLFAPTPINSIKKYNVTKLEGEVEGAEGPVCMGYPVIIDHENGAVLTISSYVNNGGSTKAIKGSKINYKVVVKNEGTENSTNNVITSIIPEGFKYVEGSASDNGVYLESANAVRWNVDVIDVESTKELTYKVSVTEDVDLDKAYISTATVMNDASDEIVSNETRVTLESIENPKTGEANKIIVLFVVCVIGLIGYYLIDRKSIIKGL